MFDRVRRSVSSVRDYLAAMVRSRTVWKGAAAIGAFWAVASVADFLPLYAGVSVLLVVASLGVLLRYLPGFLAALIAGRLNDGEQLVLGIWVAWAGDMMLRVWAISQRALGQPPAMLTSDVVTFIIFIKLMGAGLHLTSPGSEGGRIPRENWVWITIGIGIGAALTATLLALSLASGLFGER